MADNNQGSRLESAAEGVGSKIGGKFVAAKATALLAKKAIGGAIGSALGTVVPVVGNVIGGAIGGAMAGIISKASKDIAKGAAALPMAIANAALALAAATAAAMAATLAAVSSMAIAIIAGATLFVALAMFIINSGAYIVPGGNISYTTPRPPVIPVECINNDQPMPQLRPGDVRFSSDGTYAFPVAPFNMTRNECYHWNRGLAVDIFVSQSPGGPDVISGGFRPIVAYTSGRITTAGLDRSGGRIIVLLGDDNRYYYYAHNCTVFVEAGDRVSVGQVIATSDTTGSAATTARPIEHLHFAIGDAPYFEGGLGSVCPAWDFDQRFGLNRCPGATQESCPFPSP